MTRTTTDGSDGAPPTASGQQLSNPSLSSSALHRAVLAVVLNQETER